MTFAANNYAKPIISGAKRLTNLEWAEFNTERGKNIWKAKVPASLDLKDIPGLHMSADRGRGIVAR